MSKRPRCAWCDKPLRYQTTTVAFEDEANSKYTRPKGTVFLPKDQLPKTVAEAKKHTNQRIISVRRSWRDNGRGGYVGHVNVWDGETYLANYGHFCSNQCAGHFAKAAYRDGARRLNPKGRIS